MENLKLYDVSFEGFYPVGNCLIILAKNKAEALEIAEKTFTHTEIKNITELNIKNPGVVIYMDGDY